MRLSTSSVSGMLLDRLVTEQVWFRLSRPRLRSWLFLVSLIISGAAVAMVLYGLSLFHADAADLRSGLLLAAGTLLFIFLASPLSRFVYVEQQRDRACERYRAMVRDGRGEDARTAEAVTCALQADDRLTAIALAVEDLGLPLDGAKVYVDVVDKRLQATESSTSAFHRTYL